ncbi:MAG: UDP-glucose/GDP-mannose dehydrogenase family protein [Armatimonadota bacterium]|nr:UDP-glucose/GDP-mannose dehydrogenase family protein [Armatimonadota bacterium]
MQTIELNSVTRVSGEVKDETPLAVAVCGAGYVGLSTALALAHVGHNVTCVDVDKNKVAKLRAGELPFYEPHAQALLTSLTDRISFTTNFEDLRGSRVTIIAVGTPTFEDGISDLAALWSVVEEIRAIADNSPILIINKSTAPIGTVRKIQQKVRSTPSISVVSSPEFLRQGFALRDTFYPERIVVGCDDALAESILLRLYRPIVEQSFREPSSLPRPNGYREPVWVCTDTASAELTKYAANAFLATKISFINEIAELAELVGANVSDVAHAIGVDKRIGSDFLMAGLGWGGSCFPKDTLALVASGRRLGAPMEIVGAARATNQRQRERFVRKINDLVGSLDGKKIVLLGMTFKPGTDDLRDAPSLDIARLLIDFGAEIEMHDPVARPGDIKALARNADAIALVTEWPVYSELDWKSIASEMRGDVVVDGRNSLDRSAIQEAGLRWTGMGVTK